MRALGVTVLAALAAGPPEPAGPLRSGYADELTVGVDPATGVITGHYDGGTGWDEEARRPRFTCIFVFRGVQAGRPPYRIVSWFPEDPAEVIEGEIRPGEGGDPGYGVRLKEEHGGCWNVRHFADPGGANFPRPEPGGWTSVRVVRAERAHFHDRPDEGARRTAYVTTGDPVRVYASRAGWVDAEFVDRRPPRPKPTLTRGWIRDGDLFPDQPPR